MTGSRPAVFLDRDGTLNEMVYDETHGIVDSPFTPDRMVLKRQAGAFVAALNRLGYLCLVVTNQPGLAKGTLTLDRLADMHERMESLLEARDAHLDGIYFCPHHPDPGSAGPAELAVACSCRKPEPGLIVEAAERHGVDLGRSFMVGDGVVDVEAGRRAGVTTILVAKMQAELLERMADRPDARPDCVAQDLEGALQHIQRTRAEGVGS